MFLTPLAASHNASHASTEHWSRQINTSKIDNPSPNSKCGVLTWVLISSPIADTHEMTNSCLIYNQLNKIRLQLSVCADIKCVNAQSKVMNTVDWILSLFKSYLDNVLRRCTHCKTLEEGGKEMVSMFQWTHECNLNSLQTTIFHCTLLIPADHGRS